MLRFSSNAVVAAFASFLLISAASAQSTPAPAPDPAAKMTPKAKGAQKPRTAASLECSKEADAQNVHGKERKKFMSKCKKEAKAKAN